MSITNTFLPIASVYNITLTNVANTKTIELNKIFLEFSLYEGVFDFFLSGEITIADTMDIITNFPIVGGETLTITLNDTSTNTSKTLTFKLYKIARDNGIQRGLMLNRILTLYFISPEALTNERTKISKKLSGTAETLVQSIITNNLSSIKTLTKETSTSGILDVYANFWKPSKAINFISKLSKSALYSDYVFFETLNGFAFKSLSSLMSEDAIQNVATSNLLRSVTSTHIVKALKFDSYFDVLSDTSFGTLGTTYYKPHLTDYSYTKTENTYSDAMANVVGLGKNLYYDSTVEDNDSMIAVNHYDPNISAVRTTSIKTLENYKLKVRLTGDLDRGAGDIVQFDFPLFDNESLSNDSFQGNYIILKIKHNIRSNGQYEQNLLLGKNALYGNTKVRDATTLNNV
jgi:hypothetical protein